MMRSTRKEWLHIVLLMESHDRLSSKPGEQISSRHLVNPLELMSINATRTLHKLKRHDKLSYSIFVDQRGLRLVMPTSKQRALARTLKSRGGLNDAG